MVPGICLLTVQLEVMIGAILCKSAVSFADLHVNREEICHKFAFSTSLFVMASRDLSFLLTNWLA